MSSRVGAASGLVGCDGLDVSLTATDVMSVRQPSMFSSTA